MMEDLIKQGATAFKAGDRETARKLLTEAINQFPDDERAWGWMYNVSTSDDERILCLKQMIRINPKNEKAAQILNDLVEYTPPLVSPKLINNNQNLTTTSENANKYLSSNSSSRDKKVMLILVGLFFIIILALGEWLFLKNFSGNHLLSANSLPLTSLCNDNILNRFNKMKRPDSDLSIPEESARDWKNTRGCANNGPLCEDEKWYLENQSGANGCNVIYSVKLNGETQTIKMFYIDLTNERLYMSDDLNTLGVPKWVFRLNNDARYLVLPSK